MSADDNWLKDEKPLGKGSFGVVHLYTCKTTGRKLAVKTCFEGKEQKWDEEIERMKKLQHRHVVSALEEPQLLNDSALVMEYCDQGNLRQVLNQPKNCCGLPGTSVLRIGQHIGSAIKYLHGHNINIIHRDVKPENILLKWEDGLLVYKLGDLGVAKDLKHYYSCASTFNVGTPLYWAPERLKSNKYTQSVDVWSLGMVCFECSTGRWPFLPGEGSFVTWIQKLENKKDNCICAYYDHFGKVKFYSSLPSPNCLSRPITMKLIQLLRLLLRWDDARRGGDCSNEENPEWFNMLEQMQEMQLVNIFHVRTGRMFSYQVSPQQRVQDLREGLGYDSGVPVKKQRFLVADDDQEQSDSNDLQAWCCKAGIADKHVYLYTDEDQSMEGTDPDLPGDVQMIIDNREPRQLCNTCLRNRNSKSGISRDMCIEDKKLAWAHAVHFVSQQTDIFNKLLDFYKLLRPKVIGLSTLLAGNQLRLTAKLHEYKAKTDFFLKSFQTDIDKQQASDIEVTQHQLEEWWKTQEAVNDNLNEVTQDCKQVEDSIKELQAKMHDIKRRPFDTLKTASQELTEIYDKARNSYKQLQEEYYAMKDGKKKKTEDDNFLENNAMTAILNEFITRRRQHFTTLCKHLSEVLECKGKLEELVPRVERVIKELNSKQEFLEMTQKDRQLDIWNLMTKAAMNFNRRCSSCSNSSFVELQPMSAPPCNNYDNRQRTVPLLRSKSLDTASKLHETLQVLKHQHWSFCQEDLSLHEEFSITHAPSSDDDDGGGGGDDKVCDVLPLSSLPAHHPGQTEGSSHENNLHAHSPQTGSVQAAFGALQNSATMEDTTTWCSVCASDDCECSRERTVCASGALLPLPCVSVIGAQACTVTVYNPEPSQGGAVLSENPGRTLLGHPSNLRNTNEALPVDCEAVVTATSTANSYSSNVDNETVVTATVIAANSYSSDVDNTGPQSGGSGSQEEEPGDLDEEESLTSSDTQFVSSDEMSEPEDRAEC